MAEQAERGAERKRKKRRGFLADWRERLSFAATLVTVSAVAIFLGWLMGQYAIQAVTGPTPSVAVMERPPTPSPAESFSPASTQAPQAASSTSGSTASSPARTATTPASPTAAPSTATPGSVSSTSTTSGTASSGNAPAASATASGSSQASTTSSGLWRVQVGAFNDRSRADALAAELRARGFDVFVSGTPPHRVQVGAFSQEARARATADDLRALGYEAIVIPPG
ncbi:MAG: hypothetical protein BAA04_11445 [Firmicutes bacterium ZCTH02-B6]|nr:MAG: hypothetical protein BAA04_11445 [Firmicutes bacterium ZCTH02-B6]